MGEPVLVNPNSYETVRLILNEYKTLHSIGEERKWVFLGCDGPPYRLATRIIRQNEEYDWVTLVPGLGHLHMNQLKTLFKIIDKIMLEPLAKEVLHFGSSKAYAFFVNCKDTQKSFQALQIFLHGTVSEFCHQYIKFCADKNQPISAKGCLDAA